MNFLIGLIISCCIVCLIYLIYVIINRSREAKIREFIASPEFTEKCKLIVKDILNDSEHKENISRTVNTYMIAEQIEEMMKALKQQSLNAQNDAKSSNDIPDLAENNLK